MLITIIIFILVLSVLVFAHELGHFMTARFFGVKAEEFGFGFPPRAIGWYKNEQKKWQKIIGNKEITNRTTIYSLNWLPIGGFVKIKGENGEGQSETDSFIAKPIGQRILILVAGVVMNVILAWFLFSLGYLIGLPQSTDSVGPGAIVSEAQVMVAQVMPNSVAARAGLLEGDAILQVGEIKVGSEKALQEEINKQDKQEVNLVVKRNNQIENIKVIPTDSGSGRATIGVAIFSGATVRYPFLIAFWEGAKTTGWMLKEIVLAFINLFGDLFHGQAVGDQFAGPVGIANITGQAARLGFAYLLQFIALLSLNLAIINILPFPALDGGRIFFLLIEKTKGRPMRRELETLIHNIGFLLLIALVIFITAKDIIKLF